MKQCQRRKECLNYEAIYTRCKNYEEYIQKKKLLWKTAEGKHDFIIVIRGEKEKIITIPYYAINSIGIIILIIIGYLILR